MKLKQPDIKGLSNTKKNADGGGKITPMMAQYLDVKQRHIKYLLFYRMGDFYELFFDDAKIAASNLGIALTKRGKLNGKDIPMCGVPVHSSQTYLSRLIKLGFKVAIAEQLKDDSQDVNAKKKIFKRDVVRIVTPGTILEESLLDSRNHNNLLSINFDKGDISLAWTDMTTGNVKLQRVKGLSIFRDFEEVIHKVEPGEIIISEELQKSEILKSKLRFFQKNITTIPSSFFDLKNNEIKIKAFFKKSRINSFGDLTNTDVTTIGALLNYLELTQKNNIPNFKNLEIINKENFMQIDIFSQQSLEIFRNYDGQKKGSLIEVIDGTQTASGARLLREFLKSPLIKKSEIMVRHDLIEAFISKKICLTRILEILPGIPDVERAISRVSAKINNPRDVIAIKVFGEKSLQIINEISNSKNTVLKQLNPNIGVVKNLVNLSEFIKEKIVEIPPLNLFEGGVIRKNVSKELDDLRNIKINCKKKILDMQTYYVNETNINTLKIKFNNIHGYFIEVSNKNSKRLNEFDEIKFNPVQNTLNSARFQTDELRLISQKIENSEKKSLELEVEIYQEVIKKVIQFELDLDAISKTISYVDVLTNFAILSLKKKYSRPQITEETLIEIKDGRHPVVEESLNKEGIEFTSNDYNLNKKENIWVMTGPNMAGKSTFLRQVALIIVLNQVGCYVPAKSAKLGIFDKVFTRIGASDNLSQGMSTFMMEMVEAARIIDQATNSSLIILDELGRGTSTEDGFAIAYSILEYICNKIKCITLFATHYKELCKIKKKFPQIHNKTLEIKKWNEEIIFHYKIIDGISEGSFGIHVAKLAGLEESIITKAKTILSHLKKQKLTEFPQDNLKDISINKQESKNSRIIDEIKKLDLDNLSPKDSLDLLYTIKKNYLENK